MSHFYPRKSYSFAETDEMLHEIKSEMSNFLTKEEAELIINRRSAIIDPPFHLNCDCSRKYEYLLKEVDDLKHKIHYLLNELHQSSKSILDFEEPTL